MRLKNAFIQMGSVILCLNLTIPSSVGAKCVATAITLKGDFREGPQHASKLLIEITSTTPGDARKHVRQEVSIHGTHFEATAWFDTFTRIEKGEHMCDRQPGSVILTLFDGDKVLDRVTLDIEKDFQRSPGGGYSLKNSVTLGKSNPN
jgi:hypothetical protein